MCQLYLNNARKKGEDLKVKGNKNEMGFFLFSSLPDALITVSFFFSFKVTDFSVLLPVLCFPTWNLLEKYSLWTFIISNDIHIYNMFSETEFPTSYWHLIRTQRHYIYCQEHWQPKDHQSISLLSPLWGEMNWVIFFSLDNL